MLKLLYFHCLHPPTECSTQLAKITVQLRGTPLMFAYCHSLMNMVPSSSVCSGKDKIVSTQNLSQQDLWIFFNNQFRISGKVLKLAFIIRDRISQSFILAPSLSFYLKMDSIHCCLRFLGISSCAFLVVLTTENTWQYKFIHTSFCSTHMSSSSHPRLI